MLGTEQRREPSDAASADVRGGFRAEPVLFRDRAVEAFLSGDGPGAALEVAGSAYRLTVALVLLLVFVATLVAALGKVDLTTSARGLMRVTGGVREIRAPLSANVQKLAVGIGAEVQAGQTLAVLDDTEARARKLRAERELMTAERQLEHLEGRMAKLAESAREMLEQRASLAARRMRTQQSSVRGMRQVEARYRALSSQGYLSRVERDSALQNVYAARTAALQSAESQHEILLQLNELERSQEEQRVRLAADRDRARAELDAATLACEKSVLRAPLAGRIESVLVSEGSLVAPGQLLFALVPASVPLEIVAFVPEADRAFVQRGARVHVEIDQFPVGEFGSGQGTVTRVASTLASSDHLAHVLGSEELARGAYYEAQVALGSDERSAWFQKRLRHGGLLTARIVLRTRRVLALLFDPLRRWGS